MAVLRTAVQLDSSSAAALAPAATAAQAGRRAGAGAGGWGGFWLVVGWCGKGMGAVVR